MSARLRRGIFPGHATHTLFKRIVMRGGTPMRWVIGDNSHLWLAHCRTEFVGNHLRIDWTVEFEQPFQDSTSRRASVWVWRSSRLGCWGPGDSGCPVHGGRRSRCRDDCRRRRGYGRWRLGLDNRAHLSGVWRLRLRGGLLVLGALTTGACSSKVVVAGPISTIGRPDFQSRAAVEAIALS